MFNLQDLQGERGDLLKIPLQIREKSKAENRDMTDEESQRFDKAMDDIDKLDDTIRKLEDEEGRLNRLTAAEEAANKSQGRRGAAKERAPEDNSKEIHRRAFARYITSGVKSLTGEEQRALSQSTDSAGGYLSPDEQFVSSLIKALDDSVFIRQHATVQQLTTSDSLGAPSLDTNPEDANWTAEITAVDEDTALAFGKRSLHPHPLTKLVKASMKLLRTSVLSAESIVRDRLAYKFGITEEKGFMTGSGANQPLGVFTASDNGISTSRDSSSGSATSITADALIDAQMTLKSQYWPNARWIFHRDAIKIIRKLKDGNGQYLWQPGLQAGVPGSILDMPYHASEYAPNTFTTGLYVGILGDFRYYWIADSLSMQVQRLDELYAATNQVGFIGRLETDGMPVLEEAFVRLDTD